MTIKQFELFLALARTPNMRKIAVDFYMTQAAVSSSLHSFEEEIGFLVFDRVNNRLLLNEKGKILQQKLLPIVAQLKETFTYLSNDIYSGELHIGASTTLADFIIPQILYDFNTSHTNSRIYCEADNTAEIVAGVENGKYDIGFVEGDVHSLGVKIQPLVEDTLIIVTSDKDFADAQSYGIDSLMDKNWLLREKGSAARELFINTLSELGLRPNNYMTFNHYRPIKTLLENPNTLACLSSYVVRAELEEGSVYQVSVPEIEFKRTFYKVEHKDREASPLVELFVKELMKFL